MRKLFLSLSISFLLSAIAGCNGESESNEHQKKHEPSPEMNYDGSKLSLDNAINKGYVQVSANGLGTFTRINVFIKNITNTNLNLNVNSGLYFKNPDTQSQSLIVIDQIGDLNIEPGGEYMKAVRTVCTDVTLKVPGNENGWKIFKNNNQSIDEILVVYGKYKEQISQWLVKKNPTKFKTEEDHQRFLQVLVWAYSGAEYKQILTMLSNDVYRGDIANAKDWLDGVYEYALKIVGYIKQKDFNGLLEYLDLTQKVHELSGKVKSFLKGRD